MNYSKHSILIARLDHEFKLQVHDLQNGTVLTTVILLVGVAGIKKYVIELPVTLLVNQN